MTCSRTASSAMTTARAERPGWIPPLVLLTVTLVLFAFRPLGGEALDLAFQGLFWDGASWALPREHPVLHPLLYDGPKALLILLALGLIAAVAAPSRFPSWLGRRRALYLLACLALVPIACTQIRAVTRMATPSATETFGGPWPHRLLLEEKPSGYPSNAFPAGHASGGFALLALAFAWESARARRAGILVGTAAGSAMGLYQVARGEHFLSHTLATALLAWLLCALLARMMRPSALSDPTSS